jgi:hypothetical protein
MDNVPTPAEIARTKYEARTAEIRATLPRSSREFADAMSAACAEYRAAMVTDKGEAFAKSMERG